MRAVHPFGTKGEQFHPVTRALARSNPVEEAALEQLFAGPTAAEHAEGIDTALPEGLRLDSVAVRDGTATVEIALHESADVPAGPASHGCVRLPAPDAQLAYEFAPLGTPVDVL